MSIPLVQEATKDAINTSIIAIKRNIERINMLLGLVDSGSPDLSGLATKQELEDAITQVETDLAPVDEVTSGNMHSVSSNAVAEAISYSATEHIVGYWTDGTTPVYEKTFVQSFTNPTNGQYSKNFSDLPNNINRVLDIYGMINGENSFCMNIPFGDTNYSQNWYTYVNYNFNVKRIYFACGLIDAIPANTRVSIILSIKYTKS